MCLPSSQNVIACWHDSTISGVSVDAFVFSFDGQYTKGAIYKKIERLGLEVVDEEEHNLSTTTS